MSNPTNVSQLRSFVGMVNHYAKFIPKLTDRLIPFYSLLKKNTSWKWNSSCEQAFISIKQILVTALASIQLELQRYKSNLNRRTNERCLDQGNKVLVRDFPESPTKVKWTPVVLIRRSGSRLWTVQVGNRTCRRHENQILHRQWTNDDDNIIIDPITTHFKDPNGSSTTNGPPSNPKQQPLRCSSRERKPVHRLIEEI
jgi:hypothetical protein